MKRLIGWLRLGLALLILVVLGWQLANWQQVWVIVRHANLWYLAGCILIYYVGVALSCVKWQLLLQTQGHHVPFVQLFRWYLLGALAGSVLPSSIGGDLGRGAVAGRGLAAPVDAWSSIVAERLTGLMMLLMMAALVLTIAPRLFGWSPLLPLVLLGGGSIAVLLGWFGVRVALRSKWLPSRIYASIARLRGVLERYRHQPRAIVVALAISLLFHGLNAASLWLVARSIAAGAPPTVGLVYPLIDLAGLVPLTPGGLGVREGATTMLLGLVGLTADQALAIALVSRAMLLGVSLSGVPVLFEELRLHPRMPHDGDPQE